MKDTTRQGYLDWLDAKILEHQTEVARLTVARDVILEMPARRIEGAVARGEPTPAKKRQSTRHESRAVRTEILGALGNLPPAGAKPIEILHALGIGSGKAERRPYYNALSRLERDGAVIKRVLVAGQGNVYALPASTKVPVSL
jgi:hypothetical protein